MPRWLSDWSFFSIIEFLSVFRFEQRTREAAQLKFDLDKAQETIKSAESLVGKLEGEYTRWSSQVIAISICKMLKANEPC